MAVKDLEIPYYRLPVGADSSYTFDFSDVIPTGYYVTEYTVEVHNPGIVEHNAPASILSASTVLVAINALVIGESLVTVWASIGYKSHPGTPDETIVNDGLREPLQARMSVEAVIS